MKAKTMLRRLESVTNAMSSDWFTHRNFFVKDTSGESAQRGTVEFGDGFFTQTFMGGYTWRFTGNLASTEFREALMGKLPDEKAPQEMHSRLQPSRAAKGKKAAKKLPGKQRRLARVQQRSMAVVETSQETPKPMAEQTDEIEQPEPSSPAAFSSEPELEQWSDSSELPMEGLLGKRTRNDEVEYQVQWSGPMKPTWEPAANVSAVSIAEFEKDNAGKTKEPKGQKKEQTQPSADNPHMTRSAVKGAKESAK